MKKIDLRSLIIGALSCMTLFLMVNFKSVNTNNNTEIGKYQAWSNDDGNFMLNTATGQIYTTKALVITKSNWKNMSKKDIFK